MNGLEIGMNQVTVFVNGNANTVTFLEILIVINHHRLIVPLIFDPRDNP